MLKVVMDSINAVIGTSSITLDDITYQLEFILGGDLKVINLQKHVAIHTSFYYYKISSFCC